MGRRVRDIVREKQALFGDISVAELARTFYKQHLGRLGPTRVVSTNDQGYLTYNHSRDGLTTIQIPDQQTRNTSSACTLYCAYLLNRLWQSKDTDIPGLARTSFDLTVGAYGWGDETLTAIARQKLNRLREDHPRNLALGRRLTDAGITRLLNDRRAGGQLLNNFMFSPEFGQFFNAGGDIYRVAPVELPQVARDFPDAGRDITRSCTVRETGLAPKFGGIEALRGKLNEITRACRVLFFNSGNNFTSGLIHFPGPDGRMCFYVDTHAPDIQSLSDVACVRNSAAKKSGSITYGPLEAMIEHLVERFSNEAGMEIYGFE